MFKGKSKPKIILFVLLMISVSYTVAVWVAFAVPFFKVTDPESPDFNPDKFQLIDTYWLHAQHDKYGIYGRKRMESIRKLFPHGTDIVDVDNEMLRDRGCTKADESKYLKYEPYTNDPNPKIKKLIYYYCPYEWWGLFFYDMSIYRFPRLKVKVYLDENYSVFHPLDSKKES